MLESSLKLDEKLKLKYEKEFEEAKTKYDDSLYSLNIYKNQLGEE